jgi:hypothetical protein
MTTEPQLARRPLTAGRIVSRVLLTITGIIGGVLCFFVCQDVFAGYPQYGTDILTWAGLALIMAGGGVVWIIDHRRIDADGPLETVSRPDDGR